MVSPTSKSTKREKEYRDTRPDDNDLINLFMECKNPSGKSLAWELFWDGDGEGEGYRGLCHTFVRECGVHEYDEAEDAVADIQQKVWKHIGNFDQNTPFIPWLKKIASNHCKNLNKKKRNQKTEHIGGLYGRTGKVESSAAFAYFNTPSKESNPIERIIQEERKMQVIAALEELDEKSREIMVCYHFQDMQYKDIAEKLGIPIGTVMSRLSNAREKFRYIYETISKDE